MSSDLYQFPYVEYRFALFNEQENQPTPTDS